MAKRLNQVVAIERDTKKTAYTDLGRTHHLVQKTAAVTGESRTYTPKDDDGVRLPPESRIVQMRVEDELDQIRDKQIPYFDLVFTKDRGNMVASADIVLPNGQRIEKLPVPTLLWLEKQLQDLHTFVSKLPVLDPDQEWTYDTSQGVYRTSPIETVKTAKVQEPLVLAPATKEHPAQTQMITVDKVVGTWSSVKLSGAITDGRRRTLIGRVEALLRVVKQAREAANLVEVDELKMGETIFSYLFGPS